MISDRKVLVVPTDKLFADKSFTGFLARDEFDLMPTILANHEYQDRTDELEHDPSFQQIIPYCWIVHSETNQVLLYHRAANNDYDEYRLRNKLSCGIGGHVDQEEVLTDPVNDAFMREIKEEVVMDDYPTPDVVGYINLRGGIEEYHVGVVGVARVRSEVSKRDKEIASCEFVSVQQMDDYVADADYEVERWTKASWPFVRQLLQS